MTYKEISLIIKKIRKDLGNIRKDFIRLKTIDKAEFTKRLDSVREELKNLIVKASQEEIIGRKKKEEKTISSNNTEDIEVIEE